MQQSIAIIGAGLAGLSLARALSTRFDVTLFDKGRGPGGRMATRYADDYRFDHGAQFFTARSRRFKAFVGELEDAGVASEWHARFAELTGPEKTDSRQWGSHHPHYVGTPHMNAIGKFLADGLDVNIGRRVKTISGAPGRWALHFEDGQSSGHYDWLVSTLPADQAGELLGVKLPSLPNDIRMTPCFALMLGFAEPPQLDFDAARVLDAKISWISANNSKPGRDSQAALLVHSTNLWASEHLEAELDWVEAQLLAEVTRVAGIDAAGADLIQLHRWRYANIARQDGPRAVIDRQLQLAACGDWFIRGRVEAAYLSAMSLADELLAENTNVSAGAR